jgi:hypothetical protein
MFFLKFDLTIINQYMANTLDTYNLVDSSPKRRRTPKVIAKKDNQHMLIILVVLLASFNITEAK